MTIARSATLSLLACVLSLAGCTAPVGTGGKGLEENLPLGGKADSFRNPTEHGDLHFGPPSQATLDSPDGRFHAWTFTLTGAADVVLETSSPDQIDTVMYLYRREPGAETWGRYLERNDDNGDSIYATIARGLDAGEYRVIVKGFKTIYEGRFSITGMCEGAGCPGGGTDVDPALPASTPFTEGCIAKLEEALNSPLWSRDEFEVEWSRRSTLDGVERKAVGYFGALALDELDESDLEETTLYVQVVKTEDGVLVDVDSGSDWGFEFVFDGSGELLMHHFNDQSPYNEYHCGESGEAAVEEPGDFCGGKLGQYLPHDQDGEADFSETYRPGEPNDEIPTFAWLALDVYRAAVGISDDVEVSIEGRTWESHGFDQGGELTLGAEGRASVTYLVGDSEWDYAWVLTAEAEDGSRAMVCREGD